MTTTQTTLTCNEEDLFNDDSQASNNSYNIEQIDEDRVEQEEEELEEWIEEEDEDSNETELESEEEEPKSKSNKRKKPSTSTKTKTPKPSQTNEYDTVQMRAKPWTIDEDIALLEVVRKYGKTWNVVLQEMHVRHKLEKLEHDKKTYDKIRIHYNDLANKNRSKYFKGFEPKQKDKEVPNKKSKTAEQVAAETILISQRLNEMRKDYARCKELIEIIEKRELLDKTGKPATEEEIRAKMKASGAERKENKDKLLAESLAKSTKEEQMNEKMITILESNANALKTSFEQNNKMISFFERLIALEEKKLGIQPG
eukprot:TRINITY_DN301_c0_g1_i11.p2 TRINITY_DN301_c0_g1~~TRINITY_DN301_c0_g1_i11.p2  ORF type:complete len:312 (-),score=96.06 TRINITY_DN301_c0_g1_i11:126-1061(-)